MGKRTYTQTQREKAVAFSDQTTIQQAADRFGIPFGTIASWRHKRSRGDEQPSGASESAIPDKQSRAPSSDRIGEQSTESQSRPDVEGGKPQAKSSPPARVARRYTPSEKQEAIAYADKHGVSAAADELGPTRQSIYRWIRQKQQADDGEGDDPTEGPDPNAIKQQRDREILNVWHKHPGLGPSQISNQLRRRGIKVSVQTTRRVMIDNGYRPEKVERRQHDERYEALRPNHLWHLDFVNRYIHSASTFTLILLDDYSRFVVGFTVDDAERVETAMEVFEEATTRYGCPEMVMTDQGSAFWSWRGVSRFTRLLEQMGIDQIAVENKQVNGKVEAFNGNLHKELLDETRFDGVDDLRRGLGEHIWWYNHRRTHHALGGLLCPADRFYGRTDEVEARIESGEDDGPLDLLELAGRRLDLFRVSFRKGRPQVWLMGEKLYPSD